VSTATTKTSRDGRERQVAGRSGDARNRGLRRIVPGRLRRLVPDRLRRSTPRADPTVPAPGRRRWPWIAALAVVLIGVLGLGYVVLISPLLGVNSVSIIGTSDELAAQVRAAVQVSNGTPLARVDLDAVAAEVEAVPEVFAVEVARGWPDTLNITVTPRVPVAVTSANGQYWLLDRTGDPYQAVATPPAGMTVVELVAPGTGDPSTIAALTVAQALTPDFRPQVTQLSARTAFDVELTLTDGKKVLWGEATQSAQKMQILPALLAAHDGNEYDITDPTLVSVR
jgi:cell division protein FtsQ